MSAAPRGRRDEASRGLARGPLTAPRVDAGAAAADEAQAVRFGILLALLFLAIGGLLLVLAAFGGGWLHLLGAIDFLAIGAVLAWALRQRRPPADAVAGEAAGHRSRH